MTGATGAIPVQAKFLEGTIMRHVVVMTLTSAFGLMAMFLVDLADLFFLSMLKQTEVTAAIGFAGTVAFANLSMSLGAGIAATALVARNLGARQEAVARQFAGSSLLFSLLISAAFTIVTALFAEPMLRLLGAEGGPASGQAVLVDCRTRFCFAGWCRLLFVHPACPWRSATGHVHHAVCRCCDTHS